MNLNIRLPITIIFFYSLLYSGQIKLTEYSEFSKAGKYSIAVDSFATDTIGTKTYYNHFFYPNELQKNIPIVFFYPKYNTTGPEEYLHLIEHIVSRGFALIFPASLPLRFTEDKIKEKAINLVFFKRQISPYKHIIDTTRIGFLGHNFGAGMIPSLARKVSIEMKWGSYALFLYLMSPWYFYEMTERELSVYPQKAYLLMQVFNEDNVNDPKIAAELFNSIGIPPQKKEFIIVHGTNSKGMFNKIRANNLVPLSGNTFLGKEDILDTMAIFSSFDIISSAALNQNSNALKYIKGTSGPDTVHISNNNVQVEPMIKTDYPDTLIKRGPYLNPWATPRNPYASITEFRKGRKLVVKHYKDKIKTVIKFLKVQRKHEKGELDTVEILLNPIDSGYGSDGKYKVVHDSTPAPMYEDEYIRLFYPDSIQGSIPTIILVHGYSGPKYQLFKPLIDHIVSRGTAVLFPPYPQTPLVGSIPDVLEKQAIIKNGIINGIKHFAAKIDTTKIGFLGHSFGAGQIPALAYWSYSKLNWGKEGAFMFITAPWYISGIEEKELLSFPENVKLLTIVFDDDRTNDHEIGADFFRTVSIPNEDKDFVTVFSDSLFEYKMNANHFVPYGTYSPYGEENFHDYYGVFKLFDALLDFSFNKNDKAKVVALGNNSKEQTDLGYFTEDRPIRRMEVTDNPIAHRSQFEYFYTWENPLNPRREKKRSFIEKVKKKRQE